MRKTWLKYFCLYFLLLLLQNIGTCQIPKLRNDSLLMKMNLSPKEFILLTYSQAFDKYYKSKPYTHDNINSNDTIILPKFPVFNNTLIINKTHIPFIIDLSQCVFKNGLSIANTTFYKDLFLLNCTFEKGVSISSSKLNGGIYIHNSLFQESCSVDDDTIKSLIVSDTKFQEGIFSWGSLFTDYTFFGGNNFLKHSVFTEAKFDKLVIFKGNDFAEGLTFFRGVFTDTLMFHSKVHKDLDFFDTRVDSLFDISSSKIDGKIYLGGSQLPKSIDISGARSTQVLDFTDINDSLSKEYRINLFNTDVNNILFPGNFDLFFDDNLTIDQRNVVYKEVLESLDNKGYKNGHRALDIKYRKFVNSHYNNPFESFYYWLNKIWWNFGYDKSRILKISISLISIFSILIFIWLKSFIAEVYCFEKLKQRMEFNTSNLKGFNLFINNYFIALLFTIFIFFNLKLDFDKLSFQNNMKGILVLMIYGSGLVCTIFIANYIFSS